MTIDKTPGYSEAYKALEANMSPRAKRLAELEAYVDGRQYEGRPDWFSDEKPLWERAPCVVYPAVANAIDSNKDLLLGEGRFPSVDVEELEGDEAETFEKVIARIVKQARLRPAAREAFASAQGSSSAVAIFGVRSGRLFTDTVRARWCEPVLDAEGAVISLTVQYPYLAIVTDGGVSRVVARIYRRVIDDKTDTTYLPAEARADGVQPKEWTPDAKLTVAHKLGFCPVVWYPHMRGCSVVNEYDGHAIHETLTDEIVAHDFSLSQRHRAALYAGDPQWTEVGVEPGYNPTAAGRRVETPASLSGKIGDKPHAAYVSGRPRGKARKKSPGVVWQYEAKDVVVKLHTLPGEALDAIDKNATDLRVKLAESLGVVFLDLEQMPHLTALSGRTLEVLKARQLDRCDNYRSDFGDRFLLPAIGMLLRIAQATKLKIKGFEVVAKLIATAADQWSWHAPPFELTWGRYFRLDTDEEAKTVDLVNKAHDGGFLTVRKGVEKLAPVFNIKDVDAYVSELETEKAARMKEQQDAAAAAFDAGGGEGADDGAEDDGGPTDKSRAPAGRAPRRAARKA